MAETVTLTVCWLIVGYTIANCANRWMPFNLSPESLAMVWLLWPAFLAGLVLVAFFASVEWLLKHLGKFVRNTSGGVRR